MSNSSESVLNNNSSSSSSRTKNSDVLNDENVVSANTSSTSTSSGVAPELKNSTISERADSLVQDDENKIKIDTGSVWDLICGIEEINNNMDGKFSELFQKLSNLENTWGSSAVCNQMLVALRTIQENMSSRYTEMNNFVTTVKEGIVPGYEGTEEANTGLADSFK